MVDVYGMGFAATPDVQEVIYGETLSLELTLENWGDLDLEGLEATLTGAPAGCAQARGAGPAATSAAASAAARAMVAPSGRRRSGMEAIGTVMILRLYDRTPRALVPTPLHDL